MQYKPGNWVTGFKRSPRAANVQHRDMGLFLNSSGKFEPIDDSWDNLHSGGLFISDDNKLYFRDETNKDIYINSPAAETLGLSAGNATTAGFVTINEEGFDTDFRVEASGEANALFVQGSSGYVGIGTNDPDVDLEVTSNIKSSSPAGSYFVMERGGTVLGGMNTQSNVFNLFGSTNVWGTDLTISGGDVTVGNGNLGIGATPGTLFEMTSTAPYLTIKNSTHEDTEGGRESKIIFEGEQSGGEITTLAQIQASHDGTSDDQKGDLIFYTNDGSDNAAPTERMRIDSAGLLTATGDANFGANGSIRLRDPLAGNDAGIDIYRDGGVNPSIRLHGEGDSFFNGGDVGIGTDDPDHKLHVNTDSGGHTYIKAEIGATATYQSALELKTGNTDWIVGTTGGSDILWFYSVTNTAQRMKIDGPTGDVTVNTGNLVIGTADKGIDFSNQASPAAGMTSELLDRYEEGTWTPAVTGPTSISYATQTGAYTRTGNQVTVAFEIRATWTGDGAASMTGLPFAIGAPGLTIVPAFQSFETGIIASAYSIASGTTATFYELNALSVAWVPPSGTNQYIIGSGSYFV